MKKININFKNSWEDLRGMGLLEAEAINYIRGSTIPHQFILIDEAQNLTPLEVKLSLRELEKEQRLFLQEIQIK